MISTISYAKLEGIYQPINQVYYTSEEFEDSIFADEIKALVRIPTIKLYLRA
jgi:hypothetical protein